MSCKVYIVAGEVSGDAHGSGLMGAMLQRKQDSHFSGLGGSKMASLAEGVSNWVEDAAVVGFWEVLKKYKFFRRVFDRVLNEIEEFSPHIVVLVDFPGFNLRLAEAIKKRNITAKIVYYISPQVWAWRRGRVARMAKVIDRMLCLFPFEVSFYESSGLDAKFVGHPISETLGEMRSKSKRDSELVALLPGSRQREVEKIFPVLLKAASEIKKINPKIHFATSAVSEICAIEMKRLTEVIGVPCKVGVGDSYQLMSTACCGAVASGTATLEAAFLGLPYCLVYKVTRPTYYLARTLIGINFIGMANILAGRELVRELLQDDANPEKVAAEVLRLLTSDKERIRLASDLKLVTRPLAESGAYARAAEATLEEVMAERIT